MSKEKEMLEAIQNFHRVYYALEDINSWEGRMVLHHAAEHLFDAAEIKSSVAPKDANSKYWKDAKDGKKPEVCGYVMSPTMPACMNQNNHGKSFVSSGTTSLEDNKCRHCGKKARVYLINNTCEDCISAGAKI